MKAWGLTDIGNVREVNQDTFRMEYDAGAGRGLFLVCDGWNPRDPYMQKIVRELSRRSRAYSVGTRLCLAAAHLPPFAQPYAQALLGRLLRTKTKRLKK